MYSASVMSVVSRMQLGFQILSSLQLTGSLWPHQAQVEDGSSFDFIIVGAGTAGSVIANRLTEDEKSSVLLIEAGGDPPLESHLPGLMLFLKRSQADWNYTSEHDAYVEKCHQQSYFEISNGKMLGGTSSLNYHNYGRGFPKDFEAWVAACGDDTWVWKNVLPYYIKSEKFTDIEQLNSVDAPFHGTEGNLEISLHHRDEDVNKFLAAYKEVGHDIVKDINENEPLGYSKLPMTVTKGARQSSAYSYLKPARKRTNLHVLKNTMVNRIVFDDKNNAIGVEAITLNKKVVFKANKEVIVSAGVFNTPKLLMLSGIGPREELESKEIPVIVDLPVGQNLHDPTSVLIVHATDKTATPEPLNPTDPPAPAIVGYVALDKNNKHPDYETLHFFIDADILLSFCSFAFRYSYKVCDDVYRASIGRKVVFNQVINLNTKSRGQVKLRSTDPQDQPIIETKYFDKEEDIESLVEYVKDYVTVVNSTYFQSIKAIMAEPESAKCGDFERGSTEYWKCYVSCMMTGMSNYSGTCAMGTVVDGSLLVKGVNNLRVADASVMPVGVSSNPSTTVVMIGEKVADMIKKAHNLN